jgi:hypothetical protein
MKNTKLPLFKTKLLSCVEQYVADGSYERNLGSEVMAERVTLEGGRMDFITYRVSKSDATCYSEPFLLNEINMNFFYFNPLFVTICPETVSNLCVNSVRVM